VDIRPEILEAILTAIDDEQSNYDCRITFERMKDIAAELLAQINGEEASSEREIVVERGQVVCDNCARRDINGVAILHANANAPTKYCLRCARDLAIALLFELADI
jgi:late competence protein required for DNA uptake (superfamily II DNA/RNA helicase)